MEAVFFTLIIDDIVTHEGHTMMGQLGGGGPQSIFGFQVCGDTVATVGLSGSIGADCPTGAMEWFKRYNVVLEGLLETNHDTPRAWQLFEADGLRTQVWRTRYKDDSLYKSLLRPEFHLMPVNLKRAPAYHIGIHPEAFETDLLKVLKAGIRVHQHEAGYAGDPPDSDLPWVSAETFTKAGSPLKRDKLSRLMGCVDIFSPNLVEAESMLGTKDPAQMIEQFMDAGGSTIALRMGPAGSLLAGRGDPIIYVPAAACNVVDVTGCGNAFNGGLLRSLTRGDSLECAGAWGSAAAAAMAESAGIPQGRPEEYVGITKQRWMETKAGVRKFRTGAVAPITRRCTVRRRCTVGRPKLMIRTK